MLQVGGWGGCLECWCRHDIDIKHTNILPCECCLPAYPPGWQVPHCDVPS